jgi:hypothetical protein
METLGKKLDEIAVDLRDFEAGHEFTQFSREQILAWWNEGLCILHRLRPDLFTRSREFTLSPGTRQMIGEGCLLKSVDANLGQNGEELTPINPASRKAQLAWGRASCLRQSDGYLVRDYTYDPKQRDTFYVSPPVPAGDEHKVRIVCIEPPITLTVGDLGAEAPVDCWQYALVRHYVIAQAYQLDSDQAALALSGSHLETWKTILGLTTRADVAMVTPGASANVEPQARAR